MRRLSFLFSFSVFSAALAADRSGERIFTEAAPGLIAVEAEDYFAQTNTTLRAWHLTSATRTPPATLADIDPPHVAGASGGAYIEVLPDTGVDGQKLTAGVNISDKPGAMAVAHYRVNFASAGKYTIWARAFGTDGDDNTLHFGLNDTWPDTSARMHTFAGKKWQWASRHRQNKGRITLDIPTAGAHVITISMREDGCELDRFLLVLDEKFEPPADAPGPDAKFSPATAPFAESAPGVFVIEAESVAATTGWEFVETTPQPAGTGRGHLRWTVAGQGKKATDDSILSYPIRIATPGTYQLHLRSQMPDPKNRPETLDPDGNDIWLRFVGGNDAPGQAPIPDGKWTKVAILGHPDGWTWNTHADRGPPHPDTPVVRVFSAPGDYRVEFAGRSQGHAIDRIVLEKVDAPRPRLTPAEEATLDALPLSPRP
jgi:hypothetical protein